MRYLAPVLRMIGAFGHGVRKEWGFALFVSVIATFLSTICFFTIQDEHRHDRHEVSCARWFNDIYIKTTADQPPASKQIRAFKQQCIQTD